MKARFNAVSAGENLDTDLRNNIWNGAIIGGGMSNAMICVPYDSAFKCRVKQVVFTGQYTSESIASAYAEDEHLERWPVPACFRVDTVAVETPLIVDFYLTSFAAGQVVAGVRCFPTPTDAMQALADGTVMAAMGPLARPDYGAIDGVAIHQPPLAGFATYKWTLGTGRHFAYRDKSYGLDDAI